jgi:hypothetical protein
MAELRRLFSELERASAQLAAAVELRLQRDSGLPLVMFEPMSVIASRDICRICELAIELGVSSGGASKLADRLEARGYCRRHPNPGDRRSCFSSSPRPAPRCFRQHSPSSTPECTTRSAPGCPQPRSPSSPPYCTT